MSALNVAGEPTAVGDPGMGSLHHLCVGKKGKAFGPNRVPIDRRILGSPDAAQAGPRVVHHRQAPSQVFVHPVFNWRTGVAALRPDQPPARELTGEALACLAYRCRVLPRSFFRQGKRGVGIRVVQ
jgi:hypothetical protein